MMHVGILHNPLSGRNTRNPNFFQEIRSRYQNVLWAKVHTPDDILRALKEFAQGQVDCVAVNGGDGTIQAP